MLRNKLICGYCGKTISAETGTSRHGIKVNYYKCKGLKKYRNNCPKKTVRQDLLEEFILNSIIQELSKKNIMDNMVKEILKVQEDLCNNNMILNQLQKNKKQLESQLNNILKAIEMGVMNKTTNSRMKELENQIEEYDKMILIETNKMSVKVSESEIRKFYTEALKQEPILLVNYLIKEIRLFNDKAEIVFNSPLKTSPNNKGLYFLSLTKQLRNNTRTLYMNLILDFYI